MIKAIILDIGGVVMLPGSFKWFRIECSKRFKIDIYEIKEAFDKPWHLWRTDKINEQEFWNKFLGELKVDYDAKILRNFVFKKQKPNKYILKLIKKLRPNYRIYALSNHVREWGEYSRKKYKLDNYFDKMFLSYELKMAKPRKNIFLKTLKEIKCKPEECILIDDFIKNIETAKKLKINAILFESNKQLLKEFSKLGILYKK